MDSPKSDRDYSKKSGSRRGKREFTAGQLTFVERFAKSDNAAQRAGFKQLFNKDSLKRIGKEVDRGALFGGTVVQIGKGMGEFGDVLATAKAMAESDDPDTEAKELANLVRLTQSYLSERKTEFDAEQLKGGKADARTLRKYQVCTDMLREARQRQQDLVDARFHGPLHFEGVPLNKREQAREGHALALDDSFGARPAGGGTSDVKLIQDHQGQVAYAFKSVAGESAQTGVAKGGAALREAMSSTMAQQIAAQTGLNLGFPEVSIATMTDCQGRLGPGALIKGIKGRMADPEEIEKAYMSPKHERNGDAAWFNAETEKNRELGRQMPAKALNKVLLSNLAMGNFDIKWGNMICVMGEDGQVDACPFDGGAAFPPDSTVAEKFTSNDGFEIVPGQALLYEPVAPNRNQGDLAAAQQPMDPELVASFLKIDVTALAKSMQLERARLAQEHGFDPGLLDDKALGRSLNSILAIQRVLKAKPDQTMAEFVAAYAKEFPALL